MPLRFSNLFNFSPLLNALKLRNPAYITFNSWIRVDISTEEIRPPDPSASRKIVFLKRVK